MHLLNAPVFFLFFFCFDQHGLSVQDSINEFPNRVCPDQMSHTTASDLGIIDCFFFFFFFFSFVVDCRKTRVEFKVDFTVKLSNAPLALDKIGQCLKFKQSDQILKH